MVLLFKDEFFCFTLKENDWLESQYSLYMNIQFIYHFITIFTLYYTTLSGLMATARALKKNLFKGAKTDIGPLYQVQSRKLAEDQKKFFTLNLASFSLMRTEQQLLEFGATTWVRVNFRSTWAP